MRRQVRAPVAWLICALACAASEAAPPKGDSIGYAITVTDEAGKPIEAATIWMMGETIARTDIRAADLARLVARYGRDVDFVFDGDLHPLLRVLHTDAAGTFTVRLFEFDVGGRKRVRNHFAAFKRGYLPALLSDEAANNSERKLQLRLAADSQALIEPRMLELDRLHSRARQLASGHPSLALAAALKAVEADMRVLATDLEKSGLGDEAAAAYTLLANLPTVDTGKDSQGNPIIVGVTNGFRARDQRRFDDRDKAMKLQRSHPMLEFQQMWVTMSRQGFDPVAVGDAPLRTEYVKQTHALLDRHGERLWPSVRYYLWQALIREKDYAAACDVLRSFQQSEPSYFAREGWKKVSSRYREDVKAVGGPADAHCELPLPKG